MKQRFLILFVIFSVLWTARSAFAAVTFNERMTVQGYLRNGAAPLASGSYAMQFIVKNAGVEKWKKEFKGGSKVAVTNGLFMQILAGPDDTARVLASTMFSVTGNTDAITVDVVVDMNNDEAFTGADATFSNLDLVPVPLSLLARTAETANFANSISQLGATTGQVLTWNGTTWAPATPSAGSLPNDSVGSGQIQSGAVDLTTKVTGVLPVANGGTGGATASAARTALGAAASGNNTDITQLSGLATAITIAQGGTGAVSAISARSNLGAAGAGNNTDITQLSGLTTAVSVVQGGTGATSAVAARANLGAAASGVNTDITALSGLTTALSISQGGTNNATLPVTNGGIIYTNGTKLMNSGSGVSGQFLKSQGTGTPIWDGLDISDIHSTTGGAFLTGSGACAAGEALVYTGSVTDTIACQNITPNIPAASITNAQVSASAAIAYSKLNLANSIVAGDLTAGSVTAAKMAASSVDLSTSVATGVAPIARGGTNNGSLGVTAGGVYYGDGTKMMASAAGSAGQFLKSTGAGAPAFTTLGIADIKSTVSGNFLTGTSCAAGEALVYAAGTDSISCQAVAAGSIAPGSITNASVNASAAIAYSKLNLSNSIVAGDLTAGSVTAAKLASGAVDLSGTVVTNSLPIAKGGTGATTAPLARAALGAAASGANSDITSLTGLTTALSATQGGTGSASYATGNLLYASSTTALSKLAIGSAGQVLTVSAGLPSWQNPAVTLSASQTWTGDQDFQGTVSVGTTVTGGAAMTDLKVCSGSIAAFNVATAGTGITKTFTCTGVTTAMAVHCSPTGNPTMANNPWWVAWVSAADTISIRVTSTAVSGTEMAAATWKCLVIN